MARKNRPTAEIPNGSMADIAFLLLIFFLVTTTIANDKGIAMLLPPKPDPNQPPPEVTENARNIFKILANSQDKLLVEDEPLTDVFELREMVKSFILNFGSPGEEGVAIYNSLPASMKSYISLNGRKVDSSDDPKTAIVSFKADRGTSYELYVQVLDQVMLHITMFMVKELVFQQMNFFSLIEMIQFKTKNISQQDRVFHVLSQ